LSPVALADRGDRQVGPEVDETIVHAYGVLTANEPLDRFPPGIADTRVWVFDAERLAAIVSLLPVEGFGAREWEQNAENLRWLAPVARRHHEVLQHASANVAVVPLRLPSLYGSVESLADTLRSASDRLEHELYRIQGKREWAVKVYRTAKEESSTGGAGSTTGRDYLLTRSRDLSARSKAREQLQNQVREIHDALGDVSAEHLRSRPQDAALSGRKEQMLLNGAYLVSHADEVRFLGLAAEIADSSLPSGLLVEVSGPWPAYNFTGEAEATTTAVIR